MSSRFSVEAVFSAIDKMTAPVRKIQNVTKGMTTGIRKDFIAAQRQAEKMSDSFGKFSPLAMIGGVAAIGAFANKSIDAYTESVGAITNVEAGLKSTNYALGISANKLADMAAAAQKITIFEDDSILQNITAQLLTFGNIGKTNFDRVQYAVMDVTAKLKGIKATGDDLKNVSIMIGKAMDDPVKGLTAMRRVGISFSQQEEDVVKSMLSVNNVVGAQNYMLKAIERQYGGTAKALAGTDPGKIINKQNQIGDSMENIGAKLLPLKAKFFDFVLGAMPLLEKLFDIATAGVEFLTTYIVPLLSYLAPFAPIILGIVAAWQAYRKTLLVAAIAQQIINVLLTMNPIGLVIMAIGALIGIIIVLYKNWDKVIAAFVAAGRVIKNILIETGKAIMRGLLSPVNLVLSGIIKLMQLASKIPGIGDKFAKAAVWAQDFQNSMNSPFEAGSETVTTQRESVTKAIENKNTTNRVIIENQSNNNVRSGSRPIRTGNSLGLVPSG